MCLNWLTMEQTSTRKLSYLRCLSWNADGLKKQLNEFIKFLDTNNIDVAMVNETHLKPQDHIKINRYQVYRLDRLNMAKGGLLLLIKKNLISTSVKIPELQTMEALACTIFLHNTKLTLVAVYKQPNKLLYENDFNLLVNLDNKILLAGDINCKHESWNSRVSNTNGGILFQLTQNSDIIITAPVEPTFYPKGRGQPDVLDVVMYRNLTLLQLPKVFYNLNSDHLPVIFVTDCVLDNIYSPKTKNLNVNWETYKLALQTTIVIPKSIENEIDLDNELLILTDQLKMAYNSSRTYIDLPPTKNEDPQLAILLKLKNLTRRKYQKTRHPMIKKLLNKFKKKVHDRIQRKRLKSWSDFLVNSDKPANTFWRIAKQLQNKVRFQTQSPLKEDNELIYETTKITEIFARHMELQFSPNVLPSSEEFIYYVNRSVALRNSDCQLPPSELTKPIDIWNIIRKLPNNKAAGQDGITNEQLKHLPRKAVVLLCRIINKMLLLGYFPKIWKNAYITMIHKPGKISTVPTNYRPISLLSNLSKVCEKVLLQKLLKFVEENNLLPQEQFGFRHGYGSDLQLMRIVDLITTKFANKCSVLGLFLDAEKAYDKIWHQGLIYKLLQLNIPAYLVKIIQSFLFERTFQIKISNSFSTIRKIKAGVPQGAVLSPILFNLYIADIPKTNKTIISMFADDLAVFSVNRNLKYAYCDLTKHIQILERWLLKWRISININKSGIIPFTWKKKVNLPDIKVYNDVIARLNSIKYLGVTLDKKLLFKEHINNILHKAIAKYVILYPLFKGPSLLIETKKLLYTSIIRSGMTYAGGVWKFAANTNKRKLQILQNKILRTISGFSKDTKITQLHEDLEINMLETHLDMIHMKIWKRIRNSDFHIIHSIGSEQHRRITWRTPREK